MKKIKLSVVTVILLFITVNLLPIKSSAQVAVNFQVFYDDLSPYGRWVTYPGYGYVWMPSIGVGFRPYVTGGHWVYSDQGWVWVSDYDWGWAPFHYGSWIDDPSYGWVWVPGYDWAPAWVTWGTYNGYYGWAPVSPGFSISVGYYPPISHWCFIQARYMTEANWGNHYYIAHNNRIVLGGNTVITNERRISTINNTNRYGGRAYFAGPKRQDVERVTHTTINPVAFKESSKPGRPEIRGNAVSIYRPKINAGTKVYSRPANATPVEKMNSRQNASGNVKGSENRASSPNRGHANQQPQPTYQHPQNTRKATGEVMPSRGNNAHSAPQRSMTPQQRPQQHKAMPQQRGQTAPKQQPHNAMPQQRGHTAPTPQHQQAGRPAMAPQQKMQAPREPAPKQEPQREEEGRPKGFR